MMFCMISTRNIPVTSVPVTSGVRVSHCDARSFAAEQVPKTSCEERDYSGTGRAFYSLSTILKTKLIPGV